MDETNVIGCLQAAVFYDALKLKKFCIQTIATELWNDNWGTGDKETDPLMKLNEDLQTEIKKQRANASMDTRKHLFHQIASKQAKRNLNAFLKKHQKSGQ